MSTKLGAQALISNIDSIYILLYLQVPYTPKEGKLIRDINAAWERLEKAEHERELALREELIRQVEFQYVVAQLFCNYYVRNYTPYISLHW